ncbi:MAG: hypothetical protein AB7O38_01355, partial [Pirellulaceae bacterium]
MAGFALLAPWLWMFGPLLVCDDVPAWRDAGNFYYPLFQWQCAEWGAGRIPLWNPGTNFGMPALADATASVFYPGKLLFLLPLEFSVRYDLYVALHVLGAAVAAYYVARRSRYGPGASAIAAIGYAYGGPVLFQIHNVVYLVGAAWLPLAWWLGITALERCRARCALQWGLVLALIVLGGDPQLAYHIVLVLGAWSVLGFVIMPWRRSPGRCLGATRSPALPRRFSVAWGRLQMLLLAVAGGIGLSAIQIVPTWEWSQRSDRARFDDPRSLYEAVARSVTDGQPAEGRAWARRLMHAALSDTQPGTHEASVYAYSISPWRLPELVWPNISGTAFPTHRRWLAAVGGESRAWTPSLYAGLLPLLTWLAAWRQPDPRGRLRVARWLFLGSLVASFGWYGPGWLGRELALWLAPDWNAAGRWGPAVGGLYWLMVVVLPGYVQFRYPAKWLVLASWGLSLSAAHGLETWRASDALAPRRAFALGPRHRLRRALVWAALTSLLLAIVSTVAREWGWFRFPASRPDELFGPFDADGAGRGLCRSFLHAGAVGLLIWLLLVHGSGKGIREATTWLALIVAVELTFAHRWFLAPVPADTWRQPSAVGLSAGPIPGEETTPLVSGLHVPFPFPSPAAWQAATSEDRLTEIVAWERAAAVPHHHLPRRLRVVGARTTLNAAEVEALLRLVPRFVADEPASPVLTAWCRALGVTQLITLPVGDEVGPAVSVRQLTPRPGAAQAHVLPPLSDEHPRAWCVDRWEPAPALRGPSRAALASHMKSLWLDPSSAGPRELS